MSGEVAIEVRGNVGLVTLNRPQALNALSLAMIRDISAALLAWRDEPSVSAIVVRGATAPGQGVAFCAGGDLRFCHQAALAGDPRLEDFFTEEYTLDHLVHRYAKPVIALLDGIVMGGGMGIGQGASLRVVTERTKMAMPETRIGFFPDVGGGYFLSRCPGRVGEYLALTGQVIGASDAIALGLADFFVPADSLPALVEALGDQPMETTAIAKATVMACASTPPPQTLAEHRAAIDTHFAHADLATIVRSLEADTRPWAAQTLHTLLERSPLMLAVTLEQVRRGRRMSLPDDLRMERDLVRNCLHLRPAQRSETVEGIRALAIDKDRAPRWNPARIADVSSGDVAPFFDSPWPAHAHPLRMLD